MNLRDSILVYIYWREHSLKYFNCQRLRSLSQKGIGVFIEIFIIFRENRNRTLPPREFVLKETNAHVNFNMDEKEKCKSRIFNIRVEDMAAEKGKY